MIFFVLAFIVIAIVLSLRRANRQSFLQQWHMAADHFDNIQCDHGGTVSGYPALYGQVAGRRIDIAPFFHSAIGSSTTRMTGYRVKRESSFQLPTAVINSLSRHFAKVEIDDRRIFCGTHGVESSAINLIAGINKIENALRTADLEHEREVQASLQKTRTSIENEVPVPAPPPLKSSEETPPADEIVEIPSDLPAYEIPAFLREQEDKEDENEQLSPPPEAPAIADAITETEPVADPEPTPEPAATEIPSSSEVTEEAPLTLAARDLFTSGHNRFQTTQLFTADYAEREIAGSGKLLRIDTFSNDRVFGRGPGVVAEIEIDCPETISEESDEEQVEVAVVVNPSPSRITASVELDFDEEDTTASAVARSLRERTGQTVEVCGTLIRCDAFDAKLYLNDSILA